MEAGQRDTIELRKNLPPDNSTGRCALCSCRGDNYAICMIMTTATWSHVGYGASSASVQNSTNNHLPPTRGSLRSTEVRIKFGCRGWRENIIDFADLLLKRNHVITIVGLSGLSELERKWLIIDSPQTNSASYPHQLNRLLNQSLA